MNKKFKFFVKIIYYVFTFGLGIVLAISMPQIYLYNVLQSRIESSLVNGDYSSAMKIIGGYFDEDIAFEKEFQNGSTVVLFRAVTIFSVEQEKTDEKGNKYIEYSKKMQQTYAGFLCNVRGIYDVDLDGKVNRTKLLVNDNVKIELLNYNNNESEEFDTISTLLEDSYVFFEITADDVSEINSLKFIDKAGYVFVETETNALNFNSEFFNKSQGVVDAYNLNECTQEEYNILEENLLENPNFSKGGFGDAQKVANRKSIILIVVYFIWIYILGDCLVGKHYIIKGFVKLYRKIRKKEDKTHEINEEVYGKDYFSQVTFKLEVPQDCINDIVIRYSNENEEVEFVLTKEKNYTLKKRVHAGKYVNAWLDSGEYEAINLPERLIVKGYKMEVVVTLQKKENEKE